MRPASTLPLIKNKLPQYCKKLVSIPPCAFWIHETSLSNYLGLPRGLGKVQGQNEALTALITYIIFLSIHSDSDSDSDSGPIDSFELGFGFGFY